MYSIQYYKGERVKQKLELTQSSSDNDKINAMVRMRYLHQSDLIDKCWNIKSLTIDIADIKNIIFDDRLRHLFSLYARISRLNTDEIDSITILNNNSVNLLYIYEIINCDWMINKDNANYSDELLFERIKELNSLIERFEKTESQSDRTKLKNKIHLFKYWLNSFNLLNITQKDDVKNLKLGKHIIKKNRKSSN